MVPSDSTGLLRLLGHELRAPAGVIGGALTMLGRQTVDADQERTIELAQRAHQQVVDILDDVRRLVEVRRAEVPQARSYALVGLLDRVAEACEALAIELEVSIHPDADFSVMADADALVQAITACALAVSREHAAPVVCDVTREGPGRAQAFAVLAFLPRGRNFRADPTRVEFHTLRPGLGLRLVVAAEYIGRVGGKAWDLVSGDQPAGIEMRLPLAV
jgi:K+-sensing histidine kinase KdpD